MDQGKAPRVVAAMSKRKTWWVLQHPGGGLDIDADHQLHLHKTKKEALDMCGWFDKPPKPVKVTLVVGS